jgi:uncharacterized membrane protein YphA (DoxX/SURF4 family)
LWLLQIVYFDRSAGIGLLLLRAVLGAALGLYALAISLTEAPTSSLTAALTAIELVACPCLLLGFLTPIASLISVCDFAALLHFRHFETGSNHFDAAVIACLAIAAGVGLALIGPGACSLDALVFGRREVIVATLPGPQEEADTTIEPEAD